MLDTSALLALADGRSVYCRALLTVATQEGIPLAVPAAALQSAWQSVSLEGRPWLTMMPELSTVVILPLTGEDARDAGLLAAEAADPSAPIGTVHAVHVARTRGWPVVTADPATVHDLAPEVATEAIP